MTSYSTLDNALFTPCRNMDSLTLTTIPTQSSLPRPPICFKALIQLRLYSCHNTKLRCIQSTLYLNQGSETLIRAIYVVKAQLQYHSLIVEKLLWWYSILQPYHAKHHFSVVYQVHRHITQSIFFLSSSTNPNQTLLLYTTCLVFTSSMDAISSKACSRSTMYAT